MRTPAHHDPAAFAPGVPILGEVPMTGGQGSEVARVVFGMPVLHRLPPATVFASARPDAEHYALWITFDIQPFSTRARCTAVYLQVAFDDQEVAGVDVRTDADPPSHEDTIPNLPGPAQRSHPAGSPGPISIYGIGGSVIGLFAGDFDHRSPALPSSYTVQVIVAAPGAVRGLSGALRVDASFAEGRRRTRVIHARTAGRRPFTALPVRRQQPDATGVRLCMAADIERYSRLANTDAVVAQDRLIAGLARARRYAGIDEELVITQESGDGQLAVLPVGLDESVAIPRLVQGLRDALSEANREADEQCRIRVRIALHRGHVAPGPNGWIGNSTIAVHRLLDSAAARAALAEHPDADFALIVPHFLFTDVIAHRYGGLAPESFAPVNVDIPAKGFAEQAWVHVPAGPG